MGIGVDVRFELLISRRENLLKAGVSLEQIK